MASETCGSTKDGQVYFIQCSFTGRIKIGYTEASPRDRFSAIQSSSPTDLFLVGSVPGDRETESAFHSAFRDYRIHGEWFSPVPDLVKVLASFGVDVWPEAVVEPYKKRMRVIAAREDEIIEQAREELARFRQTDDALELPLGNVRN